MNANNKDGKIESTTPTTAAELVPREHYQPAGNIIQVPAGVELTPTGIVWPADRDLTTVAWQTIGAALTYMEERCGWWVLDWWIYGETKYGDLTELAAAIGCKPKTLHNKASVARQVESSRRREDLSVSIHAEVAALEPADQVKWLAAAAEHKLSRSALRESIKCGEVIRGVQGKGIYFGVSDILDNTDTTGNVVLGPAAVALAALMNRLPQLPLQNCEDPTPLGFWVQRLEPFVNLQSVCHGRLQSIGQPIEPPTAEPQVAEMEAPGVADPAETAASVCTATPNASDAAPVHPAPESGAVFGDKILTIGSKILKDAVAAVGFAVAMDPRFTGGLDNLAFYFNETGLYICATDCKQIALVRVPPQAASYAQDNRKILANGALVQAILKVFNANTEIAFYANDDYLTISRADQRGKTTTVRILMPPAKNRDEYPDLPAFRNMEVGTRIAMVDKSGLVTALKAIRTSQTVLIKADTGKKEFETDIPNQQTVRCAVIEKGLSKRISVSTQFLLDGLKRIVGEEVSLSFDPEESRVAIQSDNPNYFYLHSVNPAGPDENVSDPTTGTTGA